MRKKLRRWEVIGFLFAAIWGPLGHFMFEWSGGNSLIGAFFAVNESTWEHMKLLFFPLFLFTVFQFLVFAESCAGFFAAKGAALLAALAAIPTLFYTLGGAFGKTPDFINISIYFVAAALFYLLSFFLLTHGALYTGALQLIGFALFWLFAFLFVLFTYRPPQLPLFIDPVTGLAGLAK